MKLKKPNFWDYKKPNLFSFLLLPLTIPIFLKNFFTKSNGNKFEKIKTICVGNIYVGGTGKTSFAIKLNAMLKKLNFKTAIIKKYYKDQIDEQKILKKKNKLYCESERIVAIQKAVLDKNEIAIFDDGLQQKSLSYDISFVCFNIQNWIGNGFLLPAGPLRESLSSLKNYTAVILTGNNENTRHIKSQIKNYNSKIKIFDAKYAPVNLKKLGNNKKYLVFSGIGNPNTFKKTLLINKIRITKSIVFPDHYQYTNRDIRQIKQLAKKLKTKILTTEKDYVKIVELDCTEINFLKVDLVIKKEEELINFIKLKL